MLTIKHTVRCDQACAEATEQEFQNIQLQGQIPLPNIPAGWLFHPNFGFICPRHQLSVIPKEETCKPKPRMSQQLS